MSIFGKYRITTFQIIAFSFFIMILIGTLLLMLPISSVHPGGAGFADCLFTATSAVCVTGLMVQDTATYWSPVGQAVILLLIQTGGMGVVTTAVSLAFVSGRRIGLMQRSVMQESISAPQVGGIVRLTRFIVLTALGIEAIGAVLLLPAFIPEFGTGKGVWYAVFHSVSAFCNAGFDLMGIRGAFSSMTRYVQHILVNVVLILLITVGGIGFLVWNDVRQYGVHLKRYRMRVQDQAYGVVGVAVHGSPLDASEQSMLGSVVGECSLALESVRNAREKEESLVLAENERLRANLLRAVSHDLRTPLTSVMGNADNLLTCGDTLDEETRRQLYTDIYSGAQWLTSMVENLLSASRMSGDGLNLNMTTELMDDMIGKAIRHMGRRLDDYHLENHKPDALLFVKADARLIVQVVINLLDNAIKYSPPGSHITIDTTSDAEMVEVRVADDGPSIPDDQKEHIFDLFFTSGNPTGDSRRGLGIGLALCQSVIKAHHGTITVSDHFPHGAVFTFTLPRSEVDTYE